MPVLGASPYSLQVVARMPPGSVLPQVVAIGGTSYATRNTTVATRVDTRFGSTYRTTVSDFGGSQDLFDGLTAAQVQAAMAAYVTARKAAGARWVVGHTVMPAVTFTGPMETQRLALNDLLRTSGPYDALVDVAAIPQLTNPNDATWFSDGLHLTLAGVLLLVDKSAPIIGGLLGLRAS